MVVEDLCEVQTKLLMATTCTRNSKEHILFKKVCPVQSSTIYCDSVVLATAPHPSSPASVYITFAQTPPRSSIKRWSGIRPATIKAANFWRRRSRSWPRRRRRKRKRKCRRRPPTWTVLGRRRRAKKRASLPRPGRWRLPPSATQVRFARRGRGGWDGEPERW